jgi:uncharacterized membrane protein (DUF373 family)
MDKEALVRPSEQILRVVEVAAAYVLVVLFAIGVFDLVVIMIDLIVSGAIFDPDAGIEQIVAIVDRALLLFIIVEIYQTVVAYTRDESVVRIVIVAALIAVSRKIISFDTSAPPEELLISAGAFAVLLVAVVVALYVVRTTGSEKPEPDRVEPETTVPEGGRPAERTD